MNVFNLIVAGIVAVAVIYFVSSTIVPLLTPDANVSNHAQSLLAQAQADLGMEKSIILTLKPGQTLFARNLDSITRTVAFACASPSCCPALENCNQALSATPERILVNREVKTTLSARCEASAGIHACRVYVGELPAQVAISNVEVSTMIELGGTVPLPINVRVRNTGKMSANTVTVQAELHETQVQSNEDRDVIIAQDERTISKLGAGQEERVELMITLTRPGTYSVHIRASGMDAGFSEKEESIIVKGTGESLCAVDPLKDEPGVFDSFENACRKKVYCTDCGFAFECRHAWEAEYPLGEEGGAYYDDTRGEPGFAYVIYSPENGTC